MRTTREWVGLLCLLREREPRAGNRREEVDYPWWVTGGLALWAALHRLTLRATTQRLQEEGWPKAFRELLPRRLRRKIPDASTLSRRWRADAFFAMLRRVQFALVEPTDFGALDGTLLPVGRNSTDLFARFGGPGSGFQKGYKAVRLVNQRGQAWVTWLGGANQNEITMANALIDAIRHQGLRLRRIAADRAYDSEPFHRQVDVSFNAILLAPIQRRGYQRKKGGASRCTRRGPRRQRARKMLRTPWGRHWFRQRGVVERSNGWLKQFPYELGCLPSFIRGPKRVLRWLLCSEVLLAYRIGLKHCVQAG